MTTTTPVGRGARNAGLFARLRATPRRASLASAIIAAAALLGVAALVLAVQQLPRQQHDSARWVEHTLQVLQTASVLETHLERSASEGRLFVLTRNPEIRTRCEAALRDVDRDLSALRLLTADNPSQGEALDRLAALIASRVASLREAMQLAGSGDDAGVQRKLRAGSGRILMEQAIATLDAIRAEERRLLSRREKVASRAASRTAAALLSCAVLTFVGGLFGGAMLLRQRRERSHGQDLSRLNAELNSRIEARTAALAASEARQRGYFENSPNGLVVMRRGDDGALVHEDLNAAAEAICGASSATAVGRNAAEIWPAAVAEEIERHAALCIAQQTAVHHALSSELGGVSRCLDVVQVPMPDGAGVGRGVLICMREVTQQRDLERQALSAAEAQAEAAERETALFNNSPDSLFVVRVDRADGRFEFVYEAFSPAVERLTGLRASELVGRRPQQCLPAAIADAVLDRYRACAETGRAITYATTHQLAAGALQFEGSLAPVRHPTTGAVVRLVGAMRDVTERTRMEAALRQAQKLEAIGRLAAGVAHDFNNILQGIVGSLELILDEVGPGTAAHEFSGIALNSAERGAYLTRHLLSYARKQMLQPRTIDLAPFLSELQKVLSRTLGPHIAVKVRLGPPAPQVFADPGQLETALLNLAINAAHAMPGGGSITVEAAEHEEAGARWAVVVVADTGCGMDAATLAQAVEPFFTTKGLNGTGLGLSMVQGFAEQSEGELRITSVPGEGTRVELRLPMAAIANAADAREAAPAIACRDRTPTVTAVAA